MQVNIPPAEQRQLAILATEHGFATAEEYASNILVKAMQLEAFADLSPEEMEASVRSIERGLADVKAGRSQPAREAMGEIASEFGFELP